MCQHMRICRRIHVECRLLQLRFIPDHAHIQLEFLSGQVAHTLHSVTKHHVTVIKQDAVRNETHASWWLWRSHLGSLDVEIAYIFSESNGQADLTTYTNKHNNLSPSIVIMTYV